MPNKPNTPAMPVSPVTPSISVPPDAAAPSPQDEAFLHRTLPCRQRHAESFLQGKTPGVMQSYAPDATASTTEGFVEDDDTIHRLAHWREEAIY